MHKVQKNMVLQRCRGSEGCSAEGCGRGALCHSWEGALIFFSCVNVEDIQTFHFAGSDSFTWPQNWLDIIGIRHTESDKIGTLILSLISFKLEVSFDRGGWSVCRGCQCTGASSKSIRSSGDGDNLQWRFECGSFDAEYLWILWKLWIYYAYTDGYSMIL